VKCLTCGDTTWEYVGDAVKRCGCQLELIRKALFAKAVASRPNGDFGEWAWLVDGFVSVRANERMMKALGRLELIQNGRLIGSGARIVDWLEKNSHQSFYIHGATGTYKTTLALAVMQEAGRRGQRTAYDIGRELIDAIRNNDLGKETSSTKQFRSLDQLETHGLPFCLLIDEIEDTASGLTAYTLSTIFRMIEKFKAFKQQLVMTSNRSLEQLLDVWKYRDSQFLKGAAMAEDYCAKIDRRLQEHCLVLELKEK